MRNIDEIELKLYMAMMVESGEIETDSVGTYIEGVLAALHWVLGEIDDNELMEVKK